MHVMVNIRTNSLFQTSRSLILIFCITEYLELIILRVANHVITFSDQFKVSQVVFVGF